MKQTVLCGAMCFLFVYMASAQSISSDQLHNINQSYYGNSVAVSSNGKTVLVAGSRVNDYSGGAFVYKQTQNGFVQAGVIAPQESDAAGLFVSPALSVSADGKTAILGFWQSENYHGIFYSGIAFIFKDTDTGWQQVATLLPTAPNKFQSTTFYGFTVSISPDGASAAVGSSNQPNDGKEPGMVYVYQLVNGAWQEIKKIVQDDTLNGYFGSSVQVLDGAKLIVAGDENYNNIGRALVYEDNGSGQYTRTQLTAPGTQTPYPYFGYAVAVSGDAKTIMVGAPAADDYHGTVCSYKKTDTGWAFQTELFVADKETNDQFGWSMGLSNDGKTALIGCFPEKFGTVAKPFTGKAYLYQLVNNSWKNKKKIVPANSGKGDGFGYAVALASNVSTAVIAAPYSTIFDSTQGYVYIYYKGKTAAVAAVTENTITQKQTVGYYPNPVKDILHITGLYVNNKSSLQLLNISGNIIAQRQIEKTANYNWNISSLPAGVYILKISTGIETMSFKIIKH